MAVSVVVAVADVAVVVVVAAVAVVVVAASSSAASFAPADDALSADLGPSLKEGPGGPADHAC